uniref:Uncharacterized protein n=1 Tax=Lactuca sativa TaxID=4236 RepID=A0A9R1UZ40_LACSA|nr:hypothetical protein LSAT_V11C700388000 [Lactuca sativa]
MQTKDELNSLVKELKLILYGDDDSEPCEQACAQLTEEFFREDTMRLLIIFLPKLNLEARKDATQVVASLQRQPLPSRFQASKYLESNLDLVDILISGSFISSPLWKDVKRVPTSPSCCQVTRK